jgi:uncharacterized membrane-anchored protein YjiN (DUF445 family)
VKQRLNLENEDANNGQAFLKKWLHIFIQKLTLRQTGPPKNNPENRPRGRPLSLKIASLLNWLNLPLFWLGILVGCWLIIDYFLIFLLNPSLYMKIKVYGNHFLVIAGPGAVGYWTNWLAIKMLFYPKRNNAIWWGLIPARKEELIELMAENILQRLISPEIIREYLQGKKVIKRLMFRTGKALQETISEPEFREEIKAIVSGFVSDFLNNPLIQQKIYNSINEKIAQWTKTSFKGKLLEWTKIIWRPMLLESLPELSRALSGVLDQLDTMLDMIPAKLKQENQYLETQLIEVIIQFIHHIDLKKVIRNQFQKMDTNEFETMISGSVQTELVFIQTSGGIFGILVGLAIIHPLIRLILLLIGAGLWLIYRKSLLPK